MAGNVVPHVQLGRNADAIVVAPATARLIGCYAAGISSDLLSATLLATRAPVLVCPAMHTEMWEHPAVQDNIATLRRRGVHLLEPAEGRLAGGDFGMGRLREPEEIVAALAAILAQPAAATARAAATAVRRLRLRRRRRRPRGRSRASGPWSAPAGPVNRSTRCATSATGARASRATRSPRS